MSEPVRIEIKNCNNIDSGTIEIAPLALNIKYGPNGTGKSTVARALLTASEPEELLSLQPFKQRAIDGGATPSVSGNEQFEKIRVFDDAFVSQFVFQQDEVLKDSFEVFINTEDYQAGLSAIADLFAELQSSLGEDPVLAEVLGDFRQLRDSFTLTKSGAVAKTSRGYKALGVAAKLESIPEDLLGYADQLQGQNPAGWITWQAKGKEFLEVSDHCPFCSRDGIDKAVAKRVSVEYESAAVRNISALRGTLERLGEYLDPSALEQMSGLLAATVDLSPEALAFIASVREQVEALLTKLDTLSRLSFYSLRDEKDVASVIQALKIDLSLLDRLNSPKTAEVIDPLNAQLDAVADKITALKELVGKQRSLATKLAARHRTSINTFLRSAGYNYQVKIVPDGSAYRMLLEHNDVEGHLGSAAQHLSYGERNAFALVLFTHYVRHDQPDLVILDDPVSSFDKTKKFAILRQLFATSEGLQNMTVLMLTHDIEPAIDIVLATRRLFDKGQDVEPSVRFLKTRTGILAELPVARTDIMTFSQICDANIRDSDDMIIKLIYLRRKYDMHGEQDAAYDVLSSLFHGRDRATTKDEQHRHTPLAEGDLAAATAEIAAVLPDFTYESALAQVKDDVRLRSLYSSTAVGYEKIQIFRMISEIDPTVRAADDVVQKFVNEAFHIENEHVMQLNPRTFDGVPEFVVDACTRVLEKTK